MICSVRVLFSFLENHIDAPEYIQGANVHQ